MDVEGRDAASPWQMPWRAWKAVALRTWNEASDDNIGLVAAGVAFYGFLALVPLLGAVVLCYGIFVDPATVIRHVRALAELLPPDVAKTVGGQLLDLAHTSDGKKGLGVLVALLVALFGARNGAGGIIAALNIAYEEREKRGFIRLTATALAITAAAVVAAIIAALAIAALAALGDLFPKANDAVVLIGTGLTYLLLTLCGAAGAAALYRFGPSRSEPRWIWITPGSLLAALLWLCLTLGFGSYVANIGKFDATYGSLGAVVALLTWLYLSAYVLLFGAELNAELEHQTVRDTTTGAPRPMGDRHAWVADHVADEPALPAPADAPPAPSRRPMPARVPANWIAVRGGAQAARLAGLPRTGWVSSGLAGIGLAMLRRRGRQATGVMLVAAAAGLSLLRAKD